MRNPEIENESSVDRSPNFATPLSANPINHETDGDTSMNIIQADQTATFAEFIQSDEAKDLLYSVGGSLESCGVDEIIVNGGVEWVENLIDNSDGTEEVLCAIDEVISGLEGAVWFLRKLPSLYAEKSGAIDAAIKAIEAFVANPTEANRLPLLQASEMTAYCNLPLPRELKAKLRPYMPSWSKGKINFGNLYYFAENVSTNNATACEHVPIDDHLRRRNGRYYVTMNVPEDLVDFFGVRTFLKAINAKGEEEARKLKDSIVAGWLAEFERYRPDFGAKPRYALPVKDAAINGEAG